MSAVPLYDAFSEDYDRFVNWPARLSFEMPFFRALFRERNARRILDVACGTGQHAIAFACEGFEVTATDLSLAMIERARANAAHAGVNPRFAQLGFGELAGSLQDTYDVITCLGNSLPHLTSEVALKTALEDMRAVLRPRGILVVQNRNFDRVLARRERFVSPEVHSEGDQEWVFLRFYDFRGQLLRFNVVRLYRQGYSQWTSRVEATDLRGWQHKTLRDLMSSTGLKVTHVYGSYRGEAYDPSESGDLVLIAEREERLPDKQRHTTT